MPRTPNSVERCLRLTACKRVSERAAYYTASKPGPLAEKERLTAAKSGFGGGGGGGGKNASKAHIVNSRHTVMPCHIIVGVCRGGGGGGIQYRDFRFCKQPRGGGEGGRGVVV